MRYMTVRVDEERKTAEKHRAKREDRQNRRKNFGNGKESREATETNDARENQ